MSRSLAHTQIAAALTLTVYRSRDDSDRVQVSLLPLITLTPLLLALWTAQRRVNRIRFKIRMLTGDLSQAIDITRKVLSIGLTSLAWGLR